MGCCDLPDVRDLVWGVRAVTTQKHTWTDQQKTLLLECINGKWKMLSEEPFSVAPQCVLCVAFQDEDRIDDSGDCIGMCGGCPVQEYVEEDECEGTPHVEWMKAKNRIDNFTRPTEDDREAVIKAATAERDFLKEVLEAGS